MITQKALFLFGCRHNLRPVSKKLETALSKAFADEMKTRGGKFLEKFATAAGVSVQDLVDMKYVKQLQIQLAEGFTVLDDAFVKEIRNSDNIVTGFEIIANETKFSKLAPPTSRQLQLANEMAEELVVRSTRKEALDIFIDKGVKVKIKKIVNAIGDGTEDISKIKFE